MEINSEVLNGLVVARRRDGRCRYDPQVKQELVQRCLAPGVSVAALAMQHGINANLLRKWITVWQSRGAMRQAASEMATQDTSPFLALQLHPGSGNVGAALATKCLATSNNSVVQPMHLSVQLPNGIAVDLGQTRLQDFSTVMQTLCSLACSA